MKKVRKSRRRLITNFVVQVTPTVNVREGEKKQAAKPELSRILTLNPPWKHGNKFRWAQQQSSRGVTKPEEEKKKKHLLWKHKLPKTWPTELCQDPPRPNHHHHLRRQLASAPSRRSPLSRMGCQGIKSLKDLLQDFFFFFFFVWSLFFPLLLSFSSYCTLPLRSKARAPSDGSA